MLFLVVDWLGVVWFGLVLSGVVWFVLAKSTDRRINVMLGFTDTTFRITIGKSIPAFKVQPYLSTQLWFMTQKCKSTSCGLIVRQRKWIN